MRYDELAELYDAENAHHAMLREDVPFFLGQLPRRRQAILELGCGTGRAAIPVAQAGHRVVAIDHDPAMVALAQAKAEAAGLGEGRLKLAVGDALGLELGERFDWVFVLFNTFLAFSTLAEQDACLNSVVRHLKPGGRFFMDILQPNVELLGAPRSKDLEPVLFYAPTLKSNVLKTIDVVRDPARQLERITFRYRWHDQSGRGRERKMRFDMTFIFPRELQLLLERHGMALEHLWGNYDGSDLNANSPRMIARAVLPRR